MNYRLEPHWQFINESSSKFISNSVVLDIYLNLFMAWWAEKVFRGDH